MPINKKMIKTDYRELNDEILVQWHLIIIIEPVKRCEKSMPQKSCSIL